LAVDFGRQKAYLTEEEFLARANTQPLAPSFHGDNSDMRLNYVAWRNFVEYLIRLRGREKFQDYLLRVMADPDQAAKFVADVYGLSFDDAVNRFEFETVLRGPGSHEFR
jgi:hypothetical protein